MCDGCPDAVPYDGRLVWSCRVEELQRVRRPGDLCASRTKRASATAKARSPRLPRVMHRIASADTAHETSVDSLPAFSAKIGAVSARGRRFRLPSTDHRGAPMHALTREPSTGPHPGPKPSTVIAFAVATAMSARSERVTAVFARTVDAAGAGGDPEGLRPRRLGAACWLKALYLQAVLLGAPYHRGGPGRSRRRSSAPRPAISSRSPLAAYVGGMAQRGVVSASRRCGAWRAAWPLWH
jgi:hypothetical protein